MSQIPLEHWSRGTCRADRRRGLLSLADGRPGFRAGDDGAYCLAGELAAAGGRHGEAFQAFEAKLRPFIARKQKGAQFFAGAFAPRTRLGLLLRNQIMNLCAIPGVARMAFGREMVDRLSLPDYSWAARRAGP